MTRDEILAAARAEIGTPFRHQGRRPGVCFDCVGFAGHVANVIGLAYIDQTGYNRRPSQGLLESALDAQPFLERVPVISLFPADILLMRVKVDPTHVALFAGYSPVYQADGIIHACAKSRKVCEQILTAEMRNRIVRVYRFIGVTS